MSIQCVQRHSDVVTPKHSLGFTLVEVLVGLAIGLVIMAGLFTLFISQGSEYNYQNKRADAVLDVELVLGVIAEDLRSALVSNSSDIITETNGFKTLSNTMTLEMFNWVDPYSSQYAAINADGGVIAPLYRTKKKYYLQKYDAGAGKCLYNPNDYCLMYDREVVNGDNTVNFSSEMLTGVTMFKVFRDDVVVNGGAVEDRKIAYINIPDPLPEATAPGFGEDRSVVANFKSQGIDIEVQNPDTVADKTPGYTVLLEVAVDSRYKNGSFMDAKNRDVRTQANEAGNIEQPARKRVIRYIQVYPMTMVP